MMSWFFVLNIYVLLRLLFILCNQLYMLFIFLVKDMFMGLVDISTESDVEAVLKLLETSYLSFEGEHVLDKSKQVSRKCLHSMMSWKYLYSQNHIPYLGRPM